MIAHSQTSHTLYEQMSDGIALVDARGAGMPLISLNRACRAVLGLAERTIAGQPWGAIFAHNDAHGVSEQLRQCIDTGESRTIEAIPYVLGPTVSAPWQPHQRTYWDWHITPLSDADDRVDDRVDRLMIVMVDTTARWQGEDEDEEPGRWEIERERDAFLSLISHEIKSPLTSIKGCSQLALRELRHAAEAHERLVKHLRVIEQQTDRITRLITDLSAAARLHDGRIALAAAPFDFAARVRALVGRYGASPESHRVALTGDEAPLLVHADPDHIDQVVLHLLANVAKYTHEIAQIAVTLERRGDHVSLTVRDRGIGIPADELPRVFGRFYRASNGFGGGLGLGLFIAQQTVARSGGKLEAESALGQGSTFRVILPLADEY